MDLARAPCRAPLTARKKGSGYENVLYIEDWFASRVNYSEKSVRRFLGLENPGNFSRDSGIFFPKFKGFFSADFFEILPFFFSPNFFRNFLRHIIIRIILKRGKSTKDIFTPIHDLNV